MLRRSTRNFLITVILFQTINIVVLASLSILSWTYLSGFLLGMVLSLTTTGINVFFVNHLLNKKRTKTITILSNILRFIVWLVVAISFFVMSLFVNDIYNQHQQGVWNWIDGIFNLFTFIYGASTIMISFVINEIVMIILNKLKTKKKKGSLNYE